MHQIKARDMRFLTVDELRALVWDVVGNQSETFIRGIDPGQSLDAQALLDMHWAATDNGHVDFEQFWTDDNEKARICYGLIERAARERQQVQALIPPSTTWDLIEASGGASMDLPSAGAAIIPFARPEDN